jgi:dTDP-4-amino-4,6-dideoxygalactose transaminase
MEQRFRNNPPVPFNRAFRTGLETVHIESAIQRMHLAARGTYTELCEEWLEERTRAPRVILTNSCTAALEMAALLTEVGPGDEVIMPSFTFVTTATAFVLRGATPVFVDVREDTLNLNVDLVTDALTDATAAIVAVDYAGVGCDYEELRALAADHRIPIIEDAAQGLMATRKGRPLGTHGGLGAFSFHETKNVTCGEGGALIINDSDLIDRAEIIRDKGTNRGRFERGEVAKYTWVDIGSSFSMSDLSAAFLWGQLEQAEEITASRLAVWSRYHEAFAELEDRGLLRRPIVPPSCVHNAHMYYVLLPSYENRRRVLSELRERGINTVFHYVPLHSSPAGMRYGTAPSPLPVTDDLSARLLRLPLWAGMDDRTVETVIREVSGTLSDRGRTTRTGIAPQSVAE